jgi:hypothetical protein
MGATMAGGTEYGSTQYGRHYGWVDRGVAAAMMAGATGVLGVARRLKPSPSGYGTHTQLGLPPCWFLRVTHYPCPSCGLTTSFAWAAHFEFWKAFLASPFGLLLFFATIGMIPLSVMLLGRRISYRRITESAAFPRAVYAATGLYLMSWVFKVAEFHFGAH